MMLRALFITIVVFVGIRSALSQEERKHASPRKMSGEQLEQHLREFAERLSSTNRPKARMPSPCPATNGLSVAIAEVSPATLHAGDTLRVRYVISNVSTNSIGVQKYPNGGLSFWHIDGSTASSHSRVIQPALPTASMYTNLPPGYSVTGVVEATLHTTHRQTKKRSNRAPEGFRLSAGTTDWDLLPGEYRVIYCYLEFKKSRLKNEDKWVDFESAVGAPCFAGKLFSQPRTISIKPSD